jgi:hypothetical protein
MQHPDVPAIRKEINWWMHQDNLSSESGWRRAQSQLINYFLDFPQLAESGPTGDFTIIGAICGAVPGRLQETFPAIKLIAIMREPVARAMSQFKMCTITPPTVHWPKPPFNSMSIALEVQRQFDSIQACDLKYPDMDPVDRFFSCYVAQKNVCNWGRRQYAPGCHSMVAISSYYYMIEKWRRSGFDVDQMLFLSNEDMATDAQSTMDTVFAFIGVHPHTIKVENRNVLRGTKVYDSVDLKMMKAMRTYYEPQNALLYELTGKDFGWHYTEEEKYYDAEMNGYGISETKAMDPQVIPDVRRVCERLTKSNCKEILPPKYEACKQDHEGDHNTIVGCIRRELDAFDGTKSTRKEYPPTPLAT